MVTPEITTFCIKWENFSLPHHPFPSLSLSCLQAALNKGQEAAAFPLHPLCTGLRSSVESCRGNGFSGSRTRLSTPVGHLHCFLFQSEGLGQAAESRCSFCFPTHFTVDLGVQRSTSCPGSLPAFSSGLCRWGGSTVGEVE